MFGTCGKKLFSLSLAIVLLLGITAQLPYAADVQDMVLTAIDVGQGDAILLTSDGESMLVDAGIKDASSKVIAYLNKSGVDELDYLVATHPDADHIGGMADVLAAFDVDEIYRSPRTSTTATYKAFDAAAKKENCDYSVPKSGTVFNVGDIAVTVISNGSGASNNNDASIILKATCGKKSVLLMGDASSEVESALISDGKNLNCDILKVGHHGSAYSTSTAFLNKATPNYALISVGSGNSYGHPTASALSRLSSVGAAIYRTDKTGDVKFTISNNVITAPKSTAYNPLSNAVITIEKSNYTYTGSTIKPPVKVTRDGKALVQEANATVYVTASGSKYHLSKTCSNMKSPIAKTLSQAKAAGYTACSKCALGGVNAYKVSYSGNKSCGRATITVTGTGSYAGGSVKKYFYIVPKAPGGFAASAQSTSALSFKWSASTGATGYDVYNATLKKHTLTTSLSAKLTGLTAGKSYKIYVRAYKTVGNSKKYGPYSKAITVSTRPATPAIASLSAGSRKFSVKWKSANNVTGYAVQYSKSSKFTSPTTVYVKNGSATGTTVTGLSGGTRYYVRIRSYRTVSSKNYYSAWSAAKYVTVKK